MQPVSSYAQALLVILPEVVALVPMEDHSDAREEVFNALNTVGMHVSKRQWMQQQGASR